MLPVFFINLDKDTDRRRLMEAQLSIAGIRAERIAAIDGRNLPAWAKPFFPPSRLRPGEVGCYASHMLVWRTMLARGIPHAVVLEDDATFGPDISSTLATVTAALPDGWDFVHLFGEPRAHPFAFRPISSLQNGLRLVRFSRVPTGTVAYLISAGGAAKLLANRPRTVPIDHDTRQPWKWGLDLYGVEPGPFGIARAASAIGAIGGHSRIRRGIVGGIRHSYRSPASAAFNIRKLGLAWWLWCLAQNTAHKAVRATAGANTANQLLPLGNIVALRHDAAPMERQDLGTNDASMPCSSPDDDGEAVPSRR